jgi:3-hydroxybutyryl-CoA dehydrogenase
MTRVVVIGAGTMGRGIAAAALGAGYPTAVVDVDRDALAALGRDHPDLELHTQLEAAVGDASVVIEAVPEVLDLKRDVFARLRRAAPAGALLASNTSTMSVSRLAEACGSSPRVIGMHFFNPVHRMALVEVVVGAATSEQTVQEALALAERLGKDPIVVRDVPGFVTSRLGLALGNEAMRLVEEGVATAADVDKAMRLGYRHPMGPLELADLVGLDARLNNVRSMYEQTGLEHYRPPAILERLVAEGRVGRKSRAGFYDYDDEGRKSDFIAM